MEPLVSIVIPYFNSSRYLDRLIQSIKQQDYQHFECILVDDGSIDDSFNVVNISICGDDRFSNQKRVPPFKAGGRGAKNYGFTLTKGDFIVFFDSDDVMYTDFLSSRIDYFMHHHEVDGVFSNLGWKVKENKYKRTYRYNKDLFKNFRNNVLQDWFWLNYLDYKFFFQPGNFMWRRSYISDKPMWDESTSIGEDYEYHSRLFLSGIDIGYIDRVTWDYMSNEVSMIATSETIDALLSRSFGKYLVAKNVYRTLGKRVDLLQKEFIWQVKILRRINALKIEPKQKKSAKEIIYERIRYILDLSDFSSLKIFLYFLVLTSISSIHLFTGKFYGLYTIVFRDKRKTLDNVYSFIS